MPAATPFSKVLIANRGEIALRVMRSARALGYRTVAVYSTVDVNARHVMEADQAVCIGEALPAQSYLRISAMIEAARLAGADAIHPGYGFLAENEDFAKACQDAGLVFIGPSAKAILSMGNKAGAKELMLAAGVECIPGYHGQDQSVERLSLEAVRIGYPVMIKAVAGGGGRGMRLVTHEGEFNELLRSAQSEAKNAFGDTSVILERALIEPRHIEIQVFADRHGNAIHLGERDCSVQRRHQKVIEEAPSPAVSLDLRERMGATAVTAVKAISYEGAGTLEFLLDRNGNFFFMEMNTRLQVEHPVTEAITGLDLVELQFRVASGEPLPISQSDVQFNGHAIEVRLCAEDADKGFMPQSGVMDLWQTPPELRVEHALSSGAEISPFYDSMIAKLVAHGVTREEARRKLLSGVQDTVALGLKTNQVFLSRCLAHPVFIQGGATTSFIAQNLDVLLQTETEVQTIATALASVLLVESAEGTKAPGHGRRLTHSLAIHVKLEINAEPRNAELIHQGQHRYLVASEGRSFDVDLVGIDAGNARFIVGGVMESVVYNVQGTRLLMHFHGIPFDVNDHTRAASTRPDVAGYSDGKLRATMNGRVVAVLVSEGDRVEAGQPIVTLEAMKMEHIHSVPMAGKVKSINVTMGEQVQANGVVAEIEIDGDNA